MTIQRKFCHSAVRSSVFFAALFCVFFFCREAAHADTLPRLPDQKFQSELVEMADEYGKEISPEQAQKNPYINERLIVKSYDSSLDPDEYGAVSAIRDRDGHYIMQFDSSGAARRAEKQLEKEPSVIYVEPDIPLFAQETDLSAQSFSTSDNWGIAYTGSDVYADYLKQKNIKKSIKVAVLDSGILSSHELLKDIILKDSPFMYDYVNKDNNPADDYGHGTQVAGIIAGCIRGLDQIGIIPVKVLDHGGNSDSSIVGSAIKAIAGKTQGKNTYHKNADVINLSFTTPTPIDQSSEPGSFLKEEIRQATDAGTVVVIAAGNYTDNSALYPPANISDTDAPGSIVVSACERSGAPSDYSNYGNSVDICAPGTGVTTSWFSSNSSYVNSKGTSFSAPFVSAAAAMLLLQGTKTPYEVEKTLEGYVKLINNRTKNHYGAGILDLTKAIPAEYFAESVISVINSLPETISLSDKNSITQARARYNALTQMQKARVTNLSRLERAERQILDLQRSAGGNNQGTNSGSSQSNASGTGSQTNASGTGSRNNASGTGSQSNASGTGSRNNASGTGSQSNASGTGSQNNASGSSGQNNTAGTPGQNAGNSEEAQIPESISEDTAYASSNPHANVDYRVPLKKKQQLFALKVLGLADGDSVVSWTSSDTRKVTVAGNADGTCVVRAGRKKGNAVICAKTASGREVLFRIKVRKNKATTKKIRIASRKVSMSAGETLQLYPELYPISSTDKIKYTSGKKRVVSVTKTGVLTAKSKGSAVISIRSGKKKIKVKVTVR